MRKTLTVVSVFILIILLVGTGHASKFNKLVYPMYVKDEWGYSIKLKKAPERIISCMPSITEMLFDLERILLPIWF